MTYYLPKSINDAISLISEGAIPLAGGTVLVKKILEFKVTPEKIVDLRYLDELKFITLEDVYLEIGALVTINEITENPMFNSGEFRAIGQAAHTIGNPHVRQAGTVGGNILLNSPGADLRPVFLSFGCEAFISMGDEQIKWIPVGELWTSSTLPPFLLTKFRFPVNKIRRSGFRKFAWRKSSGKTHVSIALTTDYNDGVFQNIKIAAGGIADKPVYLPGLEKNITNDMKALRESIGPDYLKQFIPEKDSTPGYNHKIKLAVFGIHEILNDISNE